MPEASVQLCRGGQLEVLCLSSLVADVLVILDQSLQGAPEPTRHLSIPFAERFGEFAIQVPYGISGGKHEFASSLNASLTARLSPGSGNRTRLPA